MARSGRPADRQGDVETSGRLATQWYRSPLGLALVVGHVALTLGIVAVTTDRFADQFVDPATVPAGVVPWYVYAFAVLGALGYVFTALTIDFRRETADLVQYTVRLPASLPLGAGVFLFADVLLGEGAAGGPLVVGLAFLAGLYVNLAYRRLGALATRLLPGDRDGATPDPEIEETNEPAGAGREGPDDDRGEGGADAESPVVGR